MPDIFHDRQPEFPNQYDIPPPASYEQPPVDIVPLGAAGSQQLDGPLTAVIVAGDQRRGPAADGGEPARPAEDEPALPAGSGGDSDRPIDPPDDTPPPAAGEDPEDVPGNEGRELEPAAGADPEREQFIADPEVHQLASQAIEAVGPERLDHLLHTNERFRQSVVVQNEDGMAVEDPYYRDKRFMEELPDFADAATRAQVSPEQADDLLAHVLDSQRWPGIRHSDQATAAVTRVFDSAASTGEPMTDAEIARLKAIVTETAPEDQATKNLAAYAAARRAGMPPDVSADLIEEFNGSVNGRQAGYGGSYEFRQTLESLNRADVPPDVVRQVFSGVMAEHPETIRDALAALRTGITFGCLEREQNAREYMKDLAGRIQDGVSATEAIAQLATPPEGLAPGQRMPVRPPREYFGRQEGPLEHAAVPYQTERSFAAGMQDLQGLIGADPHRWQTMAEGAWIYDPASETWFSMGGETTVVNYTGHHRSTAYDVNKLSETPVSVHVHPRYMGREPDIFGHMLPTPADYRAAADMRELAGGPVQLRSFIPNTLGVTEFTYPDNNAAVREVAERYAGVREQLNAELGSDQQVMAAVREMGHQGLAQACLGYVNAALPPEFAIRLHPHDADFDRVLRGLD